jgi:hypothetical protein
MMALRVAGVVNKKGVEESPIIMAHNTIQNRVFYCWLVCQKCMNPEAPSLPLVIVLKELIILCEDCFLKYRNIFPVEDREFV